MKIRQRQPQLTIVSICRLSVEECDHWSNRSWQMSSEIWGHLDISNYYTNAPDPITLLPLTMSFGPDAGSLNHCPVSSLKRFIV